MSGLIPHFLNRSTLFSANTVAVNDGTHELTYAELKQHVENACLQLLNCGVVAGQRIAVVGKNSVDYVALYFACTNIGAVIVPINNHLKESEIGWILSDCDPAVVVADLEYVQMLEASSDNLIGSMQRFVIGGVAKGWQTLPALPIGVVLQAGTAKLDETIGITPESLAILMYTSGTTGVPKGVMLSHQNISSVVIAWLTEMPMERDKSRFLQATPLFHVGGIFVCLCTIATGSTLFMLPRFEPQLALNTLSEKSITHSLMVPSMIQQLFLLPDASEDKFHSLEFMLYGASPIPQSTLKRAIEKMDCQFLQGYGLTESGGVATCLSAKDHAFDGQSDLSVKLKSAGRELLCCEIQVVGQNNKCVAIGEIGEVIIRGANVSKGYWNNPVATAETFVDGWLRTGDLATQDSQGYICIVDRLKDMIDVSGENVYPVEVEDVLQGHDAVAEVAVIGLSNAMLGQEVVAVIVPIDKTILSGNRECIKILSDELKSYCREQLAFFKCPLRVKYIEAIPRTPAGKIKKQVLREIFSKR